MFPLNQIYHQCLNQQLALSILFPQLYLFELTIKIKLQTH